MRCDRAKLFALVGAAFVTSLVSPACAELAVGSGQVVTLITMSSVDQVCHSTGPVTVNVLESPRGGAVEISQTRAYPNFNALNTRSRCNTMKLPATRVTYQSDGAFLGTDFVTIEAIFPEGVVRRIRFPISVRPIAPSIAPPLAALPPEAGADDPAQAGKRTAKPKSAARHPHHVPCRDCDKTDAHAAGPHPVAKPQQANPLMTPI